MAKKKILEMILHDNGRAELHCDINERDDLEIGRVAGGILTLMAKDEMFRALVGLCWDIYSSNPQIVEDLTEEAVRKAMEAN